VIYLTKAVANLRIQLCFMSKFESSSVWMLYNTNEEPNKIKLLENRDSLVQIVFSNALSMLTFFHVRSYQNSWTDAHIWPCCSSGG
jgi:hypothetical protein